MKKLTALLLVMVMSMSVFCACGKNATESGSSNQEEKQTSGGSVIVGITNDMDSLDPHKAVAAGTLEVLYNVFDGLVKVDSDGTMQPAIAESYEVSEDATSITFVLRDDVYFHNGDKVEAEDVIYSLKRVAGLLDESDDTIKLITAFSIISDITESTTEDGKSQIVVSLSEPNSELIYYFNTAIIPADYEDQETAPVGAGPFKFVSYSPMEEIVLEKNNDYYGTKAYLDQVTFKIYSSTDDAFMELLSGSVDIYPYLSVDEADQLEGTMNIISGAQSLVQGLYLNNADPLLSDVRVRQAINYAIDREELDLLLTGGYSSLLETCMFPTFKDYYNDDTTTYYTHDVDKARELLTEAGYPDGIDITITIPSNYQFHVSTGEVLVSQLAEAGINATIEQVDWSTWLSDVYVGENYQTTIIGLDATMAPGDVLARYQSTHEKNFVNYENEEYDAAYTEALNAVDLETKAAAYKKCQQLLTEDAASAFLMAPSLTVAINPKLGGYTFYPIYFMDMSKVYWIE